MSFSCGVIVSYSEFHNWENRLIIQFNYTLGGRRLNENLEFQNDDYKAFQPGQRTMVMLSHWRLRLNGML